MDPSQLPQQVKIRIRPDGRGGWSAMIRFPTGDGPHGEAAVVASGADENDALHRASVIADQITSNPIFQAVAPPGTAAAINAVKMLAASKNVRRVFNTITGPGARRLGRALFHHFGF